MNYSDLQLTVNTDRKTISVLPGYDINVLQYLPIEDKNSIITLALQNAEENGVYNLLKADMFFRLYITYMYSDLEFTDEEKEDPVLIYDTLESAGIINAIMSAMAPNELEYLTDMLDETFEMKLAHRNTIASVINSFIENLPINATPAKDIIENFDPAQFQAVLNFAQAANGNRPIN